VTPQGHTKIVISSRQCRSPTLLPASSEVFCAAGGSVVLALQLLQAQFLPPARAILIRCVSAVCAAVPPFPRGRVSWTICRRRVVVCRAASGWVGGMSYFSRYKRGSSRWPRRCRLVNCLSEAPHSRHVTACLEMLFCQSTGGDAGAGRGDSGLPSSCALSIVRVA
jgi:hypothetical protein